MFAGMGGGFHAKNVVTAATAASWAERRAAHRGRIATSLNQSRCETAVPRGQASDRLRFQASGSSALAFLVRLLLACLLVVGEHRSAVAVGHFSDLDYLRGEGLPLLGREQVEFCTQRVPTDASL